MQREELRALWEPHVGKFFLSFTAIEHYVTISIDLLCEKSISNSVRSLLFEKRTEFLRELLKNNKNISSNIESTIAAQLDEALNLSKNVRNIVAHNHILLELYRNSDDGQIYEKTYIHSSRNRNKKISLENMIEAAKTAELLATKISASYLDMLGEYWDNEHRRRVKKLR